MRKADGGWRLRAPSRQETEVGSQNTKAHAEGTFTRRLPVSRMRAAIPTLLISAFAKSNLAGGEFRRFGFSAFSPYGPSLALGVLIAVAPVTIAAQGPVVEPFRLMMPDGKASIDQASDLCFGQLGGYAGLWIAPDRNSGESGNQIFLIDQDRLARLKPGEDAVATHAFATVGPAEGWERFAAEHPRIDPAVLNGLREQFENFSLQRRPILDFEGITIAPRLSGPRTQASGPQHDRVRPQTGAASRTAAWSVAGARHGGSSNTPTLGSDHSGTAKSRPSAIPDPENASLFVVTEQPHSLVLEFSLIDDARPRLMLVACFLYSEKPEERGGDANDGIEGVTWAGKPGRFFICEEGTRPHREGDTQHFFDRPRLMRCTLANGVCNVEEPWSTRATEGVRSQRDQPSQTLDALTRLNDQTLLAVDRNGGWILAIDIATGKARQWINLYDPKGLNLRHRLDQFPRTRHMPYVSIEGIAIDDRGDLWLCDDPAMPEGFRESCLIRVKGVPAP